MSGREGDVKAASSSMSKLGSIPRAANLPVEVISHREHRRKLFARGRETEGGEDERELPKPKVTWHRERRMRAMAASARAMGGSRAALLRFVDVGKEIHPIFVNKLKSVMWAFAPQGVQYGCESLKFEAPRMVESEEEGPMRTLDEEEEESSTEAEEESSTEAEEEGHTRTMEEQEKADEEDDADWLTVSQFRDEWNDLWSDAYGAFEDTTRIPSMRFTDNHVEDYSPFPMATLQIFSVKLAATRGSLHLPLNVFGMVAVRDPIDHNRNIIFQCTRDDCQTLTEEDPYLVLAGPTRAVMFIVSCPVIIEIDLKVKGTNDSADECLSFRVAPVVCSKSMYSHLLNYAYTSKLSTLEFTLGHIVSSVEATIFVQVTHGSWPDGLRGVFAAFTTGICDRHTGGVFFQKRIIGTGHERIVLLDSRGEKSPTTGDGKIKLSRRVVSVETSGKVIVRVKALEGDKEVAEKESSFDPLKASSSTGELEFSFCKIEVTVFWSLISQYPEF